MIKRFKLLALSILLLPIFGFSQTCKSEQFESFAEHLNDVLDNQLPCNVKLGDSWYSNVHVKQTASDNTTSGATQYITTKEIYRVSFSCDSKWLEFTWRIQTIDSKDVSNVLINGDLDKSKTSSEKTLDDYLNSQNLVTNPWYNWIIEKAKNPINWK